ncbi:MAG: hypothetical protein ACK5AZ_13750 [Bryobacteraceae bacterium]
MKEATTAGREFVLRWPLCDPDSSGGARSGVLCARPFGHRAEDLDVDLLHAPVPSALTALFARCLRGDGGSELSESELWRWTVTRRMQALLAVASASGGTRRETAVVCPEPECRQTMQIELDLRAFRRSCDDETFRFSPDGAAEFVFRLPNGLDQLRFVQELDDDPLRLVPELIASGDLQAFRPEWLPLLEAELEERDPFTVLELSATCPGCGASNSHHFDLEAFLLRDLARKQTALLEAIHRIARAYHWSEREILALPPHRRDYYLGRIDREVLQ